MAEASTDAAFRIVELVSLLLPIVLVVLQFTVRYYRREETGSPAFRQALVLIAIGIAAILTIASGWLAVDLLVMSEFQSPIGVSLRLLQFAVALFAVPVVVIVLIALSEVKSDLSENAVVESLQDHFGNTGEEPNPDVSNSDTQTEREDSTD